MYSLHEISEYHMELISTALNNENVRLAMLAKLTDEQFKEVLLNDALHLNAASGQQAVDIEALKTELNDPRQLKQLRSNSQFGKNSNHMQRLLDDFVNGQKRLLQKANFDIPLK